MYMKQCLMLILHIMSLLPCVKSQDYFHTEERDPIDGEYTTNLKSYEFLVPHKVSSDGDFMTFSLPNFFQHDYTSKRRRRDDCDPDVVNYNLHFNGRSHHIQLWPNHGFLSPETIAEYHYPGSEMTIEARKLRRVNPALCHYTGTIKGMDGSRAALSLCEGLAGYLKTAHGDYYIEPVKDFSPNENGHHLHVVYTSNEHKIEKKSANNNPNSSSSSSSSTPDPGKLHTNCGTHDDWREGWKRAFHEHYRVERKSSEMSSEKKIATRKATPRLHHRYMEILVVADKMFMDFHKDKDHENYILTVMNMVSDYFHDSSTGSQLDVVVVRIIYLDETISALDVSTSPEAGRTLKSFCKWQNEINPKDPGHPQHHDIAVLITRHDICSDEDKNCGLLGLAYMASACVPSDACSINEDKGLILGVVIAHELGHIMGCQHDCSGEVGCPIDSGCPAKGHDAFNHVMAPYVTLATTIWSQCSRAYMRELLDNNLGECLSDEPEQSTYKYEEMLAGVVYDADYQCSLIFTNSTHCPVEPHIFCERLFCKVASRKCLSNGQPPADGTKCSANKWCFKRKCIDMGERPNSIDGGWSKWTDYSACSRTCGGGVQVSDRTCSNPYPQNGGLYCMGGEKRYKICNTKSCPMGSPSFRAVQCAEFDKIPRNGRFHKWTPYFPSGADGVGTCILYCINEEHVYAKLSPRIKDGTPCRIGTMDMCLTGQCRKVGCDWVIDSEAVSDKCGVCDGDNSGCKHVTGYFSESGTGYKKVVILPKGARNIIIRENASSENTIAIANKLGHYFLNGENREESDGEKYLGKDLAIYVHPGTDQEELYISGPLHQPLVFYVAFYQPRNSGFTYEYYIRDKNFDGRNGKTDRKTAQDGKPHKRDCENKKSTCKNRPQKYHWDFVEWSKCSVRCDGGEKISKPVCVDTHFGDGGVVNEDLCDGRQKPEAKSRVCNRQPCKAKWHTGEWGICSGCKHQPGFQQRHVWCATESLRWESTDMVTSNEKCKEQEGPKPKSKQLCMSPCTPACRSIRDVGSSVLPENVDEFFYLVYYTRVDSINLKPKQRVLEIANIFSRVGPVIFQENLGAKSGRDKILLPRQSCSSSVTTPFPNSTVNFEDLDSNNCLCTSSGSYKNKITVRFPVVPPFEGSGNGNVIISSKKVKKSNDPASEKMKNNIRNHLKNSILSSTNNLTPFDGIMDQSKNVGKAKEQSRLSGHWSPIQEGRHPAAMLLVENHPNLKDIQGPNGLFSPRFHRKFRHGRHTDIRKPCHPVVSDKIPDKSLVVIEVPLKESTINMSDFTFEHMGDMASGTLDLSHQKQLCGKDAIEAWKIEKNCTNESSEDP